LELAGFQTLFLSDPYGDDLAKQIQSGVDACEDDDLLLLHFHGEVFSHRDGLKLTVKNSRASFDFATFERHMAERPSLRCVLSLEVDDPTFASSILEWSGRFAVIVGGGEGLDSTGFGLYSYALAQALGLDSRTQATTLGDVLAQVLQGLYVRGASVLSSASAPSIPVSYVPRSLRDLRLVGNARYSGKPWFGKRLLWVDDDPSSVTYEVDEIVRRGALCTFAWNTDQALDLWNRFRFDALITDMGRPPDRRAGYTLLDAFSEQGPTPPAIIFSSRQRPEHAEEAKRHGALGSTDSSEDALSLLEEAFSDQRDAVFSREMSGWRGCLRYWWIDKRQRPPEEQVARFREWLAGSSAEEAEPILVDWLRYSRDWKTVETVASSWARYWRDAPGDELLQTWIAARGHLDAALRAAVDIRVARDPKNAGWLLAACYSVERTREMADRFRSWVKESGGSGTVLPDAISEWQRLPKRRFKVSDRIQSPAILDSFNWEVFLDESLEYLDEIWSVDYLLHETFGIPIRRSSDPSDGFRLKSSGWGGFEIRLIVTMRTGERFAASHQLRL
jgi:CheY-like chemotaxis protein